MENNYAGFMVKQLLLSNYSKFTKQYYGDMLQYGKYIINHKAFVMGMILKLHIRCKEILQEQSLLQDK